MKWLNRLIGSLLNICGLDTENKLGGSLQFFIYDMIKIMVLLGALIFVITYIQSYFPPERTKKILGRFLVYTAVYGLYKCRASTGSDVLVSYLVTNG